MRCRLRSDLITQSLLYTNNDNELFFDRELSWLSFNERVIKTSTNKNIPLAERLRFLIISAYNFDGWAVLEWVCCIKSPQQGAEEGGKFIKEHIIDVTEKAFDDFADSGMDEETNKKLLGI